MFRCTLIGGSCMCDSREGSVYDHDRVRVAVCMRAEWESSWS